VSADRDTRVIVTVKEAARDYGRCSRATLARWVAAGIFPQPRHIGPKRIGFIRAELDEWLLTRDVGHRRRTRRREVV
jgi:predicted DNA-binding transcriptional regulator AlpA